MASKRTGRGTVLFGLLVLFAGLAGAVVLFVLSRQRGDDAIRDLARAPVGCDTTLSFSDTGTFYVFIEHLGSLDALDGDCETPEEYSRDPEDEPRVTITLTDGDGNEIELDRVGDEFTYSLDDSFAGTATRQVEIESTGDYVVTVESPDGDDFVVAIGRDPAAVANTMLVGALASAIAGIVLGLLLVLIGVRRGRRARRIATAYTAEPRWPDGAPLPTAPPTMQAPLTERMPAPTGPGAWSPDVPVGPPAAAPDRPPPSALQGSTGQPTPSPFAPPQVFAPPGMPTVPAAPPADPIASPAADEDGDVRGDASP
jgi:hypothetical protein